MTIHNADMLSIKHSDISQKRTVKNVATFCFLPPLLTPELSREPQRPSLGPLLTYRPVLITKTYIYIKMLIGDK